MIQELQVYPQRDESRDWNRYLHTCVHGSIAHSHQKVETTQGRLRDEWMHKVWAIHMVGHYSALKRKGILTGCNMDEHWGPYAQ